MLQVASNNRDPLDGFLKGFAMTSTFRALLFSVLGLPLVSLSLVGCDGQREGAAPLVTVGHEAPPPATALPDAPAPPPVVEPPAAPVAAPPLALPTTYVDALALGKQLAAKGDHARATELFALAIELDRRQAEPHIELARLAITKGERANAIRHANRAVKLGPSSSQAYNTLGRAELARFDYEKAIAAFTRATELNPDNAWAWNNLGYVHLQLEHYEDAVAALTEATRRKDATGYMWNNLGTAYEHLDQLDDARLAFESGGALGSKEAAASRKRLEGVDSVAIYQRPAVEADRTYELREEMPPAAEEDAAGAGGEPGEEAGEGEEPVVPGATAPALPAPDVPVDGEPEAERGVVISG